MPVSQERQAGGVQSSFDKIRKQKAIGLVYINVITIAHKPFVWSLPLRYFVRTVWAAANDRMNHKSWKLLTFDAKAACYFNFIYDYNPIRNQDEPIKNPVLQSFAQPFKLKLVWNSCSIAGL